MAQGKGFSNDPPTKGPSWHALERLLSGTYGTDSSTKRYSQPGAKKNHWKCPGASRSTIGACVFWRTTQKEEGLKILLIYSFCIPPFPFSTPYGLKNPKKRFGTMSESIQSSW